MLSYDPPLREQAFLLREVLGADDILQALPGFKEIGGDMLIDLPSERRRFCGDCILPLNWPVDQVGWFRRSKDLDYWRARGKT